MATATATVFGKTVEEMAAEMRAGFEANSNSYDEVDEWAEMRSLKAQARQIRLQRDSVRREKYFVEDIAVDEI